MHLAWVLLLTLGWTVFAVGTLGIALSETGLLRLMAVKQFEARAGEVARGVEIEDLSVHFLERTIELSGVRLANGDVELDMVRVWVDWSAERGLRLAQVEVDGGHLRISETLMNGLRTAFEGAESEASAPSDPGDLPTLAVQRLSVAIATQPDAPDLDIGSIDAILHNARGDAPHRLDGRLRPPSGTGGGAGGVLRLQGELTDGKVLAVDGYGQDLTFTNDWLPEMPAFSAARELDPHAVVDLQVRGRYVIGESTYPEAELRLGLRDGGVTLLPISDPSLNRVDQISAQLSAAFDPADGESLWDRSAWSATAHLGARWSDTRADAWMRFGRAARQEHLAEAWFSAPGLVTSEGLVELLGKSSEFANELMAQIRPGGEVDLSASAYLPADWRPGADPLREIRRAIAFRARGKASAAYHGGINEETGERDLGFPLRVDGIHGDVIYAFDGDAVPPETLGVAGVHGSSAIGDVTFGLTIHKRPLWFLGHESKSWMHMFEFFLRAQSTGLSVGPEMERGFRGLAGLLPPEELWELYNPSGGALDFDLRMWTGATPENIATRLDIGLQDVGITWEPMPLPMHSVHGALQLTTDGTGIESDTANWCLSMNVEGSSPALEEPVTLIGHIQGDPQGKLQEEGEAGTVSHLDIAARGINLRHAELRRVCAERAPAFEEALRSASVKGFADATLQRVQALPDEPALLFSEAAPRPGTVQVTPEKFPMQTMGLEGRAITIATEVPAAPGSEDDIALLVESRIEPGVGAWDVHGRVPVAVTGLFPADESLPPILDVHGAGIDTSNRALLGSISAALHQADPTGRPLDLDSMGMDGRVDFRAHLTMVDEPGEGIDAVHSYLRGGTLIQDDLVLLENVSGRIDYDGELMTADKIHASLASTPVEFEGFVMERGDVESNIRVSVTCQDLPIDYELLRNFIPEEELLEMQRRLEWRGRVDVNAGLLRIILDESPEPRVRFQGPVGLRNLSIQLGLPISITRADVTRLALEYEEGALRGSANVESLYGDIAGRSLDNASMVVSLINPRLEIREFDAAFAGGRLRSQGLEDGLGAGFLAVDLEAPFPFRMSIGMVDTDVGKLLEGIFGSDFANEGRLECDLHLEGDTEHLTEITGVGFATINETTLWSIPVFQALFSQLGFETTAIFTGMGCHYRIEGGVIDMQNMWIESPLLSLVGSGTMDFGGRLHHDLEVRYSLVDRLGLLTRLVYKIQNSLLRISIRGDMSRPKVVLRGLLSRLVKSPGDGPPELPLPGPGTLPERF